MGFFNYIMGGTLKQGVFKNMVNANKRKQKCNTTKKSETLEEQEIREKIVLAKKIKEQAKEQANQLLKIIKDCVELVNTTVNPDVFFNRYNLMLEHIEKLSGLECTGIFENSPELPSQAFVRVEEQFSAATNDFLDRSFENAKKQADTLKTDKGKINAINRYFDNMEKYIVYMSGESIEHFDKIKETYQRG